MKNGQLDKEALQWAMQKAYDQSLRENQALNLSTLVARDGKLISIAPDGSETVIGETKKPVRIHKLEYEMG